MFRSKKRAKEKIFLENANCKLVATTGVPKDFFDKPGCKEWLKNLADFYEKPELENIGSSARNIGRIMENKVTEVTEAIKANGQSWAKCGVLSLQADHFISRKATSEMDRSFLGIILNVRNKNFELIKIPLCFKCVKEKTFAKFRTDLKQTLKVFIFLSIFNTISAKFGDFRLVI